jgi:simple sugar transport system permease protein
MAVQAEAVAVPKAPGMSRGDVLVTLFIVLVGAVFLLLGGASTQAGEQSTFTDRTLGTLFSLPSQTALYAVGAFCFFVAGLRLFRGLSSLRAVLNWSVALLAAFGFLVWITSGTSMNLPGMLQATLMAATPLTLGAICGIFCERAGIINIAIEGMMLWGAFAGVAFASIFDSLWMGVLGASLVGGIRHRLRDGFRQLRHCFS